MDQVSVRIASMSVLGNLQAAAAAAVPLLCRAAASPKAKPVERHAAVTAFAKIARDMQPDSDVCDALIKALAGETATGTHGFYDSYWMSNALATQGELAVPALQDLLGHGNKLARETPAMALSEIGKHASPAVPKLAVSLDDESKRVRVAAAIAIGSIAPATDATATADRLLATLASPHSAVRAAALQGLAGIDADDPRVLPALIGSLDDRHYLVRHAAARALASMGPRAADAAGALARILQQPVPCIDLRTGDHEAVCRLHFDTRVAAAEALAAILPDTGQRIPQLLGRLAELPGPHPLGCRPWLAAAQTAAHIGAVREDAVQLLIPALGHELPLVRQQAATSLAAATARLDQVVQALSETLSDRHSDVVRAAARSLAVFGHEAAPALPVIEDLLKRRRFAAETMLDIAQAALAIEPGNRYAVHCFRELLANPATALATTRFCCGSDPANARALVSELQSVMRDTDHALNARALAAAALAFAGQRTEELRVQLDLFRKCPTKDGYYVSQRQIHPWVLKHVANAVSMLETGAAAPPSVREE